MLATKQLTVAIDIHSVGKNLQKKETYSGLKQHEGEKMMTELYFFGWTIRLSIYGKRVHDWTTKSCFMFFNVH